MSHSTSKRKKPTLVEAQRAFDAVKHHKDAPSGSLSRERYIVALDNLIGAERAPKKNPAARGRAAHHQEQG